MNKYIFTACLISTAFSTYANDWTVPDLMVGKKGLQQTVQHRVVGEGIDFYQVTRGKSVGEAYLLSSGVLNSKDVDKYTEFLNKHSIKFLLEKAPELTPNNRTLESIIRIRNIGNKEETKLLAKELQKSGLNFSVRYSAQDGYETSGPFTISLLRIDLNKYQGKIKSILAKDKIYDAESVTSMAARNDALAAINAGFFVFNDKVGDYGAPAGIYVQNGMLLRDASNGKAGLLIDNSGETTKLQIGSSITSTSFLLINGEKTQIDGINRQPGILLNCGGYGDTPSNETMHDYVCTDKDEITAFNSFFGESSPSGEGKELIVNPEGKVVSIADRLGANIKPDYIHLQATGGLLDSVNVGDSVVVESLVRVDNKDIALKEGMTIINAGPVLVKQGNIDKTARNDGWNPYPEIGSGEGAQDDDGLGVAASDNREGFYNGWILRRHPRTAIGMTDSNIVYAAVVYGRQPTVTEGASISDMENLMKALSVDNALNLDGGGSSMMIVDGKNTGNSSDATERKVSDALIFTK
ncbi:phosphodiester glycosidase family protein [Vibrio sp. TRT 17S01]|uniref:phosphodiester glycosidase family protein n=1 Tax=Vibrio sp. TRT 17S01 TaxID=3418505 RepID=UPI003CEB9B21